ncbi:MAG: hypothetical protein ACKOAP_07275 [Vulcanococcus sp.]
MDRSVQHSASLTAVALNLPESLVLCIRDQAQLEGVAFADVVRRLLEIGIADQGLTVSGRCSLRTGLCSQGPTPLPVQQASATD